MGLSLLTVLPADDRAVLSVRVNRATCPQRDVLRARIVLDSERRGVRASASHLGCSRTTVATWRGRYREHGLPGLGERPRSGAPATYTDQDRRDLIAAATAAPPPHRVRWTHALLAEHLRHQHDQHDQHRGQGSGQARGRGGDRPAAGRRRSPSRSWIGQALRDGEISVHKVRGWLHRRHDPSFDERVAAIEDAVNQARAGRRTVISLDEKTAVPVRTPCHVPTTGPGGVRRREFEYRRAGTLSWYGTQDVATGTVALTRAETRMDSDAFTMVLDDLVAAHGGSDLTVIMDNGSAHTSRHTRRWMSAHRDVTVLFTPVHASWTNPVEVQFSVLARQVIIAGHHTSADALDNDAQAWVTHRNQDPRPVRFTWQRRGPGTSKSEH